MNYIKIILFISTQLLFANIEEYLIEIDKLYQDKNYKKAAEVFKQALAEYDASSKLYYQGALIYFKSDDLDLANKYFIEAIKLEPKNEEYRSQQQKLSELKDDMTKARKTFDSGLLGNAISEYIELSNKYPQSAIVYYNLGLIYKADEKLSLAVENYKYAQNINPFNDKYSQAIYAIAQMSAIKGDEEYRRQEFDTAIDYYRKSIEYYPEYTTAIFKLARTYYRLQDFDNTLSLLKNGLTIDPQQEQSEKMLGDIYRRMGDTNKAIEHYKKSTKINKNYYQAYYSLGSLFLSEGNLIYAANAFNNSILIEPTYSKAYGSLGIVEQELGNIDNAIKNYSKAVEYDQRAYDIYYRLASAYNIEKQYENAKSSAKKSLNIKRNYAPAYFELGLAEKHLGNKIAAKDAFGNAKKDRNWRKSAQFQLDLINKGL